MRHANHATVKRVKRRLGSFSETAFLAGLVAQDIEAADVWGRENRWRRAKEYRGTQRGGEP